MTNETRQQITDALAKATPCPKCGGDQFLVTGGSHAEHDPSCDGSCLNCPVEVPDQDVGPCDCVMQQANVTEADYQRVVGWLRALLADLDAADAQNQRNLGLLEVIERLGVERDALKAEVERMKFVVMAHKTWENEAVARASNANFALNKIREDNKALRADRDRLQADLEATGQGNVVLQRTVNDQAARWVDLTADLARLRALLREVARRVPANHGTMSDLRVCVYIKPEMWAAIQREVPHD